MLDITPQNPLRNAITAAYRKDETVCINELLQHVSFSSDAVHRIQENAKNFIFSTRKRRHTQGDIDTFLNQYDLSSDEGIALMCLAEALLRIPDHTTQDRLISDKISTMDWYPHINRHNPWTINIATLSLFLTGKMFASHLSYERNFQTIFKKQFSNLAAAITRPLILQGMKIIGKKFVMGTTIEEALQRAKKLEKKGYRYSYDMLGEAARTAEDAETYYQSYIKAITAIGTSREHLNPIHGPGISIKLSALHPRYEFAKRDRVLKELTPRLLYLAEMAKKYNIGLTVDAEEADRLELSLDVIETVFRNPALQHFEGFGLAIQAYQKRTPFVIDWLADLSKKHQRKIMVRLVKGAYWDSEIKISQLLGLEGYPVFTRKNATDVSYIACAKKLISFPEYFYPQFGTHNAYSVAAIMELLGKRQDFEFQCLHGMGTPLYDSIVDQGTACRIYAPVGTHKDLLGYLVRRLLENGANTNFINQIANENTSIEQLTADPVAKMATLTNKPHPYIPLPRYIYHISNQPEDSVNVNRLNSKGLDLTNVNTVKQLKEMMDPLSQKSYESGSIIEGNLIVSSKVRTVLSPRNQNDVVGRVFEETGDNIDRALTAAVIAQKKWEQQSVETRAACLERAAELFEENIASFIVLLNREGGKQIADCVSEIRETIDFCRYYAARAKIDFAPKILNGPTGEFNQLTLHPRGIILCISPWNFPLAIFAGQILAALAAGNAVVAKPSEQTALIAAEAVRILHTAGIPDSVLQLLTGKGSVIGSKCVADPRVKGVMFTGSTETAQRIQQTLTQRPGPIVPFIAETGGQNVMIVDSSALPEQVVQDVIISAFNSAGQRCSALRVLFLQEEIAPQIITMLKGAMAELTVGDPSLLSTDIGPVIDQSALQMLQEHAQKMQQDATLIYQVPLKELPPGHYFAPCAFEIPKLSLLKGEVFGPILHIIRYKANELDKVLDDIIDTGYGLTMGIHSRIDSTVQYIQKRMPVGNLYINRNMIGAVVGVQPFGGEGLSGTGPKAGGPYYLPRLCVERSISINTTAAGGNTTLLSLSEEG